MDEAAKSEMTKLEAEVNSCGKTLLELDADSEKLRLKRLGIVGQRDKALKRMRDLNAGLVPFLCAARGEACGEACGIGRVAFQEVMTWA